MFYASLCPLVFFIARYIMSEKNPDQTGSCVFFSQVNGQNNSLLANTGQHFDGELIKSQ